MSVRISFIIVSTFWGVDLATVISFSTYTFRVKTLTSFFTPKWMTNRTMVLPLVLNGEAFPFLLTSSYQSSKISSPLQPRLIEPSASPDIRKAPDQQNLREGSLPSLLEKDSVRFSLPCEWLNEDQSLRTE